MMQPRPIVELVKQSCRLSYFFVWLHHKAVTHVEIIGVTVLC